MTYQDYILRHIQQAGRVWAQIVRMIKDRKFEAARMVLDQACRQLVGLSPETVLERNPNDLIARLRFDETPAAGRDKCLALATLLRALGDLTAAHGDSVTAAEAYHLALLLVLDSALRDPDLTLPADVPTVESLDSELSAHSLPITTQQQQLLYYEQAGDYAYSVGLHLVVDIKAGAVPQCDVNVDAELDGELTKWMMSALGAPD